MRLVLLGRPFIGALLQSPVSEEHRVACSKLLTLLQQPLGGTSFLKTRQAYAKNISDLSGSWPSTDALADDIERFWGAGMGRSQTYEPLLRTLLPTYNTGSSTSSGFLTKRPDLVVADFSPCSLLSATSRAQVTKAIARTANVMEFTAQKSVTVDSVRNYLASKMPVYVSVTQDQ